LTNQQQTEEEPLEIPRQAFNTFDNYFVIAKLIVTSCRTEKRISVMLKLMFLWLKWPDPTSTEPRNATTLLRY